MLVGLLASLWCLGWLYWTGFVLGLPEKYSNDFRWFMVIFGILLWPVMLGTVMSEALIKE